MEEKMLCRCVAWFGNNLNFLCLKMDDILGQTLEHVLS